MSDPTSDFDAAKAIYEQLKDMDAERQIRILRWVSESLKIDAPDLTRNVEPPTVARADADPGVAPQRSGDIKSFVDLKQPSTDVQFATVVAYYYRFEAGAGEQSESINSESLQNATRLAGRARLAKPITTLNNAKKQGYLDSPARGEFVINSVGENLVAMALPGGGDVDANRMSPTRRPRKTSNKSGTRKKSTRKKSRKRSAS